MSGTQVVRAECRHHVPNLTFLDVTRRQYEKISDHRSQKIYLHQHIIYIINKTVNKTYSVCLTEDIIPDEMRLQDFHV